MPLRGYEIFPLNARLFWPKPAVLNGVWGMPAYELTDGMPMFQLDIVHEIIFSRKPRDRKSS